MTTFEIIGCILLLIAVGFNIAMVIDELRTNRGLRKWMDAHPVDDEGE